MELFGGNLMIELKETDSQNRRLFYFLNFVVIFVFIVISYIFIINEDYAFGQTNINISSKVYPDPADDATDGLVVPSGNQLTGNDLVHDSTNSGVSLENYSVTGGFSAGNQRVYDNRLTIESESNAIGDCNTTCKGSAYGGWSSGGQVDGNTIIIEDNGTPVYVINNVIGGESKGSGVTVSSNTVTVTNINAAGVFGGRNLGSGIVEDNNVTIDGGTFYESSGNTGISMIRGGSIESGNAKTNHVTIKSDSGQLQFTSGSDITGGYTGGGGNAEGNTVEITSKNNDIEIDALIIVGGHASGGGNAIGNTVEIATNYNDGTVNTIIFTETSDPSDNTKIIGGLVSGGGNVESNIVKLTGIDITITGNSTAKGDVYGGKVSGGAGTAGGEGKGNQVFIDGIDNSTSTVYLATGHIYGGVVDTGTETGITSYNNVEISNVNIDPSYSEYYNYIGGVIISGSDQSTASYNKLTLSNVKGLLGISMFVGGLTYANNTTVSNNTVIIKDNSEVSFLVGGYAWNTATGNTISENNVILEGATVGFLYGGLATDTTATNNHVKFVSGTNEVRQLFPYGDLLIENGNNTIQEMHNTSKVVILGGSNKIQSLNIDGTNTGECGICVKGGTTDARDAINAGTENIVIQNGSLTMTQNVLTTSLPITARQVTIKDSGVLTLNNNAEYQNGTFVLESGAIVDIGIYTLDLTGSSITTADNSTIKIKNDGTNSGLVNATNSTISGGRVTLDLTTSGTGTIQEGDLIVSGVTASDASHFYNPDYIFTTDSNGLIIGHPLESLADEVADLVENHSIILTPNISSAIGLVENIYNENPQSELSMALYSLITELHNNPVNVEETISQLIGEAILEVHSTITDVAVKAQGLIYGRLDKIRTNGLIPPSAGSEDPLNHLWIGTFGSWARQKEHDLNAGYKYNSWGVSLGYDRNVASLEGLLFGINLTFATGELTTDHDYAKVDIDTIGLSAYGSYTYNDLFFFDATAALARSKSNYEIQIVSGGRKTGEFNTNTFMLGLRTGFILNAGSIRIVPSAGVRYTRYNQKAFVEDVHNTLLPANVFEKSSDSIVEIPFEIRFSGTFDTGSTTITPSLKLGYTSMVRRPDNRFSVGFVGSSHRAEIMGAKPSKNTFQAGLGLKIETEGNFEFFLEYDGNYASHFTDHRISVGFGGYF
jgi:outer membrane autotransporter protein